MFELYKLLILSAKAKKEGFILGLIDVGRNRVKSLMLLLSVFFCCRYDQQENLL